MEVIAPNFILAVSNVIAPGRSSVIQNEISRGIYSGLTGEKAKAAYAMVIGICAELSFFVFNDKKLNKSNYLLMGHAYLVAAHHQMQLLQILLHLIDDERNEIYLHVDKKCKEFKEEEFRQTVKKAKIHFIERRSVTWGGYSQIQLELDLLKEATNTYHDYYHLISGVDLPLKSQNEIYNFFEIHKGMQFVSYDYKMDVDDVTNRLDKYGIKRYKMTGPIAFLTLMENAEWVLTQSFHASTKYRMPFSGTRRPRNNM